MRPTPMAALAGAIALLFLFTTMVVYHRDNWHQHLRQDAYATHRSAPHETDAGSATNTRPTEATGSPSREGVAPFEGLEAGTVYKQGGPGLAAPPSKAVVMARKSSEDTTWVAAELAE